MQKNFVCPVCSTENSADAPSCIKCGSQLGMLGAVNSWCPNCSWRRVPYDRFCGNCGMPLQPICPNCGNSISRDSRYCPKCSFFCGQGRDGLR